jgi:hypothetical protein
VVQVDELVRRRDVTDNVESGNGFALRGSNRRFRCRKTFALARIFRPLPHLVQIFEGVAIFDKYVHEGTT